jgi:hypothetical protein
LRFARFVAAALALTTVAIAPFRASAAAPGPVLPTTAVGAIGLRLVAVPLATLDDPRAQIYIVDHLAPGTVLHREIEISNTTAATANIALYPAAATIVEGSFLGAAGRTANDLSSWTSVTPNVADLPAGGRLKAAVTITVPNDAPSGEHYGVVWAESPSAPATASGGIMQVSRVGIRLYLSVGAGGAPRADFTIDSLTAARSSDGQPTVVATVHNSGGRALDMSGTLQLLTGPSGLRAGPFDVALGSTIAIGATAPVTITLDKQLPAGPWDAQITLRSGLLERSARATITFPDMGAATAVITTTARHRWLSPAIAGLAAVLLLGILVLAARLAHFRRSARDMCCENG